MKTIFLFLMLLLSCTFLNAQNLIAVEHNGVSVFYSTLDSAVNAAQTGDNVYVPGGNFTLNVPISKGFNLIGVGYNPDSTIATGFTQITNTGSLIYIVTGADNGSITGIYFYNVDIQFGTSTSNQTVNNFIITKCRITYVLSLGVGYPTSTNLVFTENIFESTVNGANIQNSHFYKNIFTQPIQSFLQGNEFDNNIFLLSSSTSIYYTNNSIFKNNVFLFNANPVYFIYNSASNTFVNNLFVANLSGYLPGTDIGSLYNVSTSSLFVNQSGSAYDYKQNYHLKSTSPGKNYGTDGTDLGVYGTATPWKEGGVPYNPHIQFQSIATQTDGSGNLSINIKVAAQKN